jgi:hypothetical protein
MAQTSDIGRGVSTLHAINISTLCHMDPRCSRGEEEEGMECFPIGYMM